MKGLQAQTQKLKDWNIMKEKQYSTMGRAQTTKHGHIEIKHVCSKHISAIYQLCNFGKLLKTT